MSHFDDADRIGDDAYEAIRRIAHGPLGSEAATPHDTYRVLGSWARIPAVLSEVTDRLASAVRRSPAVFELGQDDGSDTTSCTHAALTHLVAAADALRTANLSLQQAQTALAQQHVVSRRGEGER